MPSVVAYGNLIDHLLQKRIDWDTDTIKVALLDDTYTPNQDTHDFFDDVSASEVTGTGYTAGGETLASKTSTYDSGTNVHTLDAADVSWTSSTITARYGVIYDASPGTAATNPLIAYVDFDSNQSSSSGTFQITWNASGIMTWTIS